jgi:glycosyltransferase involved in cell wall biosynthesis
MKISVVIPVYNSAKILKKLISKIRKSLKKFSKKNEIILINDFSKDTSWNEILKIVKKYNNIKGINLDNNYGQHNAIMAGLKYAKGEYVVLMDDDLQHDPKYIENICHKLQLNYDVCYTKYINRKHETWKIALSLFSNFISSFLINKPTNIYASSFKGFKKKIAVSLCKIKSTNIYIDSFIFQISKNITTININHLKRFSGSTNYSLKKLIILWSVMVINMPINFLSPSLLYKYPLKLIVKNIFYLPVKKTNNKPYNIAKKTF